MGGKSGMSGMMGGGMGRMMEQMGAPKPKELYPSLMEFPDLAPEKRAAIQRQAQERRQAGSALVSNAWESLLQAAAREDYPAMQAAVALMHEGLAQFESGLAAQHALAEGTDPRQVALQWFKREMNLLPPAGAEGGDGPFGYSWFHTFVMLLLGVFASVMLWMYAAKMRRAANLLERLALSTSAPPTRSVSPHAEAQTSPSSPQPPPSASPAAPALAVAVSSAVAEAGVDGASVAPSPAVSEPLPAVSPVAAPSKPQKWSGQLRVARIFEETPDVKTFRFVNADGGPLPFTYRPGQFLVLSVAPDGQRIKRSYTIASSPTQQYYCEITVKREEFGLVSGYLHDKVTEGDSVEVTAPNGQFTFTGQEANSIVLIGGGVGITPLMSVIRYLTDSVWTQDIFLLFCCRTSRDFIFRDELESLQRRHSNLHVVATMTRAEGTVWMGLKGRFNKELLAQSVPDLASRRIHVCGPPPMMEAVRLMLSELEVPPDQIKTEAFGPALRPAAKRAVATGCTCERCERRRAEAVATLPPVPAVPAEPSAAPVALAATVTFQVSNKSAPLPQDETILDVADEIGVEIDNSCRVGACGMCKIKLLSGAVSMEIEDALDAAEKAQGLILACQAKSTNDVAVEA